ncbi:hypothetical protein [Leifsonia sp. SIMBA_070]|uniref:hypothetical protein n=1 Tax=Leifsonia sp. SIMBA_070 TaxID=3085810 RepID=UPI00397D6D39
MVAEESDDTRGGGFDPRYDPSFQRGYQPQPGERSRVRVRADSPDSGYRRPSSVLPADDRPGTGSDSASRHAGRDDYEAALALPDASEALTVEVPRPLEAENLTSQVIVASPGRLAGLDMSPRRNPLILALWIVGPGLIVLGITLYTISITSSYNGPTPSSDVGSLVFAQLGWMLAGPLITVGLLTLVGLLFLTALAGRRSREAVPLDEEL